MRRIVSVDFSDVNLSDDMSVNLNLSKEELERNMIYNVLVDLGYEVGMYFPITISNHKYQICKEKLYYTICHQLIGIPADSSFNVLKTGNLYLIDFYY